MARPGAPTRSALTWYARRLRSMSPQEVAHRAATVGGSVARRVTGDAEPTDAKLLGTDAVDWAALLEDFRAGTGRPVLLDRATAQRVAAEHPEATAALVAAADRVLEHRFTYFAHPEARYDGPIDWWLDPLAGFRWPDRPADEINHRSGHGDPKWIWELNRLQHLPWLAQAWLVTGEDRYGREALEQLDSWIAANPPGRGIAWRGAFEVGIRALSVTVALRGLADHPDLDADRYRDAVRMLAAGARRCWRDRSRHSSANNHLVGELAGLAAVATTFPELARARRWERDALAALAVEARRQILPDGVGAEQAVGYQVFTAELLGVVALLRRLRPGHTPTPDDAALLAAVGRSAGHLADLVGDGDPAPRTGDDDEGFALRLAPAPVREVREHLALAAVLTGEPAARRCGREDLTAAWVAARLGGDGEGGEVAAGTEGTDAPWAPHSAYAPDGGVVVVRDGTRRVLVDVGPLGYLSIAAHGHADALAVGLAVDGRELIGDPGTGSYFVHPDWRDAHRSTRDHATVAVDDVDQSVSGGPFLWTEHATTHVHDVDLAAGRVDAEHDGYRRLDGPVTHRRVVEAPPGEDAVLVVDVLTTSGEASHRARTTWPLHPDLVPDAPDDAPDDTPDDTAGTVVVRHAGTPVLAVATGASTATAPWRLRGGDADAGELGWWSERLEARRPCWLVGTEVAVDAAAPTVVATVLRTGADPASPAPRVTVDAGGIRVGWDTRSGARETVIDPGAARARY
ncbi:heparinase II/III family protein [Actinomycetospora straminea]|uniref:Alginate lyase family protein n=1 Tax=Actinomycetospora straminea TaxID=663607 RepID=A0ABP9E3T5_9PSEU|nr:alginate lyase family protein [Actinomycetospora straminea]MDD7931121.1 alginate lyase family protein [Actinomycetospora straminea]